jgi:hypothetical protein
MCVEVVVSSEALEDACGAEEVICKTADGALGPSGGARVRSATPAENLLQGFGAAHPRDRLPFARMATSAISGASDVDLRAPPWAKVYEQGRRARS